MILVYYRDRETGNITSHHEAHGFANVEELNTAVQRYNAAGNKTEAHTVVVRPGSLEQYLLTCVDKRLKHLHSSVRFAIDNIQDALDAVRDLEVRK